MEVGMLNVFTIRKLQKIYEWYIDPVSCDYHYTEDEPLKIYTEYNIMCAAQYLASFELVEDDGIFILKITKDFGTDVKNAGSDIVKAIDIMIEVIIETTQVAKLNLQKTVELTKTLKTILSPA